MVKHEFCRSAGGHRFFHHAGLSWQFRMCEKPTSLVPVQGEDPLPAPSQQPQAFGKLSGVRVFLVHLLRRPLILPEHPEAAVGPVNRAPSPRRLHGLCNEGEFPRRLAYVCLFVKVEPVATRAGAATEGEGVGSCRACACKRCLMLGPGFQSQPHEGQTTQLAGWPI